MRKFILPYRKGSKTVQQLGVELDIKAIRLENSKYVSRDGDVVINWGNSTPPPINLDRARVLNNPERVGFVSNKKNFFRIMSDFDVEDKPRIPEWTLDKNDAKKWYDAGDIVFIRTKLTGHSGQGIVVLNPHDEEDVDWDDMKKNQLFVKYVKKKLEFRAHFFNGEVFDIQRKAKQRDREDVNFLIRSHNNGFVYVRNDVGPVPDDVITQANKTVKVLGLDFGAIDIIYNQMRNEATVLEVNSAPGLEGTTFDKYVEKFQEI